MKKPEKPARQLDLHIRGESSISPEHQLVAQLKLSIMLGKLEPGDTLPSVRELAGTTGVGRNVVWRAYSKLAQLGAVRIQQRRRAVVAPHCDPKRATELVTAYEKLGSELLKRTEALRINAQSFIRFLSHRIHESGLTLKDIAFVECSRVHSRSWSGEISRLWGVDVAGYDLKSVQAMSREERLGFKSVITPMDHYDEVRDLFKSVYSLVIPLKYTWDSEVIRELKGLPDGSRMGILVGGSCYVDPWVRELGTLCPNLEIEPVSFESIQQVRQLFASGKYSKVHLSGTVLDTVYPEVSKSAVFVQQPLKIDRRSLEQARIQAGVVL